MTWHGIFAILRTQDIKMGCLVEDLLMLAKIDDAELTFVTQDVDLEELNRLKAESDQTI